MLSRIIIIGLLCCFVKSNAQDSALVNQPFRDTSQFTDLFTHAKPDLHLRSVYMATINQGALKDDEALAGGFGAGLTSGVFRGFQAGVSAFVVYNIWSTDLERPEPATWGRNRYEAGLFDITDPGRKFNLLRLENLFVRYSHSRSIITLGRMKLNTPFLNTQDGRMNVTMEEGVWVNCNEFRKIQINAGWFWSISPRSTTQWYSIGHSLGVYPKGVSVTGMRSGYPKHISSSGVGILHVVTALTMRTKLFFWETLVDNVMHSAMIGIERETGAETKYYQKLFFIHQDAIHHGGNANPARAYLPEGAQSNSISGRAGIKRGIINTNINATYITGDGRYLAPREWGSDPFYTFIAREKNDGFGNVKAASVNCTFSLRNDRLRMGGAYGYFSLPDVKNYRLNKYGMPSYHHYNCYVTYAFAKALKGLDIILLVTGKTNQGETYGDPQFVYNKVNLLHIGLFANYRL